MLALNFQVGFSLTEPFLVLFPMAHSEASIPRKKGQVVLCY